MLKQKCFYKCVTRPSRAIHQRWSIKSCPCASRASLAPSRKVHLLRLGLNLAQQSKGERCAAGRAQREAHTISQGLPRLKNVPDGLGHQDHKCELRPVS